ncbi:PAS domain-containing protein [Mesorhizobium sp. M0400]|uniref:PAS domain-containing protein n=1 Tax=Mesorhizobium sp. M0400 TaxID=2956941 RepID=UPI0033375E78
MDVVELKTGGIPQVSSADLMQALPVAVYTTDRQGYITFFNEAAADLWGYRPVIGQDRWWSAPSTPCSTSARRRWLTTSA